MRNLFDDFLEELRRREAAARGEDPGPRRSRDGDDRNRDREDDDPESRRSDDPDDEPAMRVDDDAEDSEPVDRPRPIMDGPRGGGTRGGPPRRRGPGGPNDGATFGGRAASAGRRFGLGVGIILVLALVVLFGVGLDLWTDALWYASVGFDSVFWTRLTATFGLFIGAFVLSAAVLFLNLWVARRLAPPPTPGGTSSLRGLFDRLNEAAQAADGRGARPGGEFGARGDFRRPPSGIVFEAGDLPDLTPLAGMALGVVAVFAALLMGGTVSAAWETVLLWTQQVPFSPDPANIVSDPVFGRDIGFFLFELPFLRLLQGLFNGLVIAALLIAATQYLVGASRSGLVFTTPIRVHLAVLAGLFLLSVAFGYQLDKYELVYSTRGVATGVSFTDQNAQFFAYDVLTVISGLAAALLVGGAFARVLWPLGFTIAVWFLASLIIGRLYPEAIQRFTVVPNPYAQEERYIGNNIAMTRLAYGLDSWSTRQFRGEEVLTQEVIDAESDTFRSARLWDYRPLGDTLDQLQTVRKYYDFTDVDTDRYTIDGIERQVMLSARELALEQNPSASGWLNQRIIYTHGVGVTMVPVNEIASEGQPRLLIGNLPPVSSGGAPDVTEPRIYFGERDTSYVVVGARQAEFDYPTGETDEADSAGTTTIWSGTSGIRLDNTMMRLLFALRFRDLDLLISDQITNNSQMLFHRTMGDRLGRIAPFLRYDKDPYVVISEAGRLVYVQDAYTVSDRFPHAQGFDPSVLDQSRLGAPFNYIRNSVKITMDAYDGSLHFYMSDPSDPIVRAYGRVFPDLFEPLDAMPADLRSHLRVPEELFNVQVRQYGRYHVTNTEQFFRTDDLWTVPEDTSNDQTLPSEAYYVVMRLPGEEGVEFALLQPMVPTNRPNMIAWIAARMDEPNYGSTVVYRFPADSTIFGPAQIEARIDQDAAISQQISLWNQSGSKVIRGNLIVVPLDDSLIYLQPVYLQSTGSAFPEFRRIVVASPREVVWAETLGESLRLLLEAEGGAAPAPSATPSASPTPEPSATPAPTPGVELPTDVPGLIDYANAHFELAQEALRDGDFARYGTEIELVEAALRQLQVLAPELGSPLPEASATPAP
jgi:uncharacterized membrane protein (UPF0182 family)